MEKIKPFIRNWLYVPIFFISFSVFDLIIRSCYIYHTGEKLFSFLPMVYCILWSFFFTAILMIIPGIAKKIYAFCLAGFFVIYMLTESVVKLVSGSFCSFSDFQFADDGLSFLSIKYFAIPLGCYIAYAVFLGLVVLSVLLMNKEDKKCLLYYILVSVVAIASFVLILIIDKTYRSHSKYSGEPINDYKWTDSYDTTDDTVIYDDFTDLNRAYLMCGTYQYFYRCFEMEFLDPIFAKRDNSNIIEYMEKYSFPHIDNEMTGALKNNKNVICILLESVDQCFAIPEIMPNLCKIRDNSINFENNYTPLFITAGTYNTEYSFNCSKFLPPTGTSAKTFATNSEPYTIASYFSKAGFTARSFHMLDGKYYNRKNVHKIWGYLDYYSMDDLHVSGSTVLDTTLLKMYDHFFEYDKNFNYLITYSGHGPYTEVSECISDKHIAEGIEYVNNSGITFPSADTKQQFTYAVAQMMETDEFLGGLIEKMEADGHINDTALVLFTDHWCKYLTDKEFVKSLKGAEDDNMLCHTPLMIYSSETKDMPDIEKVTTPADIMPTMLNLFDIGFNAQCIFGKDAYAKGYTFVAFRDYSWYDGKIYHKSSEPENDTYVSYISKEVYSMLNASWDMIKNNYFAK